MDHFRKERFPNNRFGWRHYKHQPHKKYLCAFHSQGFPIKFLKCGALGPSIVSFMITTDANLGELVAWTTLMTDLESCKLAVNAGVYPFGEYNIKGLLSGHDLKETLIAVYIFNSLSDHERSDCMLRVLLDAIHSGNAYFIIMVLQGDGVPYSVIRQCLKIASQYGNAGIFSVILEALQRRNTSKNLSKVLGDSLMTASGSGSINIVQYLLADLHVSPLYRNSRALAVACQSGQCETVNMLMYFGADPCAKGGRARRMALANGHTSVVCVLDKKMKRHH